MQVLLDEELAVEENGFSPLIEIKDERLSDTNKRIQTIEARLLAVERGAIPEQKIDSILNSVNSLTTGVATLTERQSSTQSLLRYAAIIAFMWLSAISGAIWMLWGNVSQLEGKGGSYQSTEKALSQSKSPAEVAANLNLIQAQIQKRDVSGDPLDPVELTQIGVTVNAVTRRYPQLPVVWSAASNLVNIRYQRDVPANLPNCWDLYKGHTEDGKQPPSRPAPKDWAALDEQRIGNCLLTLDDGPSYRNSGFGKAYERNLKEFPAMKLQITAHDVIVSYNGGNMIPFSFLECHNCVFRLNVSYTPSSDGQKAVRRLLTADTSSVQISGSQSGI